MLYIVNIIKIRKKIKEMDIYDFRMDYEVDQLSEENVAVNPIVQFEKWFKLAIDSPEIVESNAMHIATVDLIGRPSGRIVLLKSFGDFGFQFFTNYESKKGKELAQNPFASLTFFWPNLEKQIRIEGVVEKISEVESQNYFITRPLKSQIGAIASPQSSVIEGRQILEDKFKMIEQNLELVKKPEQWGGYILKPSYFEFWQGRRSRLHDRIFYEKNDNSWKIGRLAP